jgi:hypothetical protein
MDEMPTAKRVLLRGLLGVIAVGAVVATGCQTRLGGVPYPTPHYLQHYPTYIGPDPAFPLQRERDSMLDPTGEIRRGAAVAPALGGPPDGVAAPAPVIGQPAGPNIRTN